KVEVVGDTNENGTTVKFKPDCDIFSARSFDSLILKERMRAIAFLNPGIKLTLVDARSTEEESSVFYSEKGIIDMVDMLRGERESVSRPILINREMDSVKVNVALQYVKSYSEELLSFVNNVKTTEGGTHVIGFHAALSRAIIGYIQKNTKKPTQIEGEDAREGLIAIISVLMPSPEFEGQTKEKLGSQSIRNIVDSVVYQELNKF
ncbi:DNA gyrase subunit B, partial [mine drainage metagenome]